MTRVSQVSIRTFRDDDGPALPWSAEVIDGANLDGPAIHTTPSLPSEQEALLAARAWVHARPDYRIVSESYCEAEE